jgi:hypothetical protein
MTPIPADFSCYCAYPPDQEAEGWTDAGYGHKALDAYGKPLCCLTAGQITALKYQPRADSRLLLPALAYIAALPPDMRIALDWH